MDQTTTARTRTVAVLGAGGAGKTTLVEALALRAGLTTRAGTVEDGSTLSDHEPEEISRQISLNLGVVPISWTAADKKTYDLTFLDTPGYLDFAGVVDDALAAADLALVVVSAVEGVQTGTYLAMEAAAAAGVPTMIVVTKEDKQRADFRRVLDDLRNAFTRAHLVPLELPVGEEEAFTALADLLAEDAVTYDANGSKRIALPDSVGDEAHEMHEQVVEEIVSGDDDQLERYLSGEVPTAEELGQTLAAEVCKGEATPVVVVSGTTGVGADRLADLVCELSPSIDARNATVLAGDAPIEVAPDPSGPTLVHAFRTMADPFVGQVTLLRVLSGTLKPGDRLVNQTTHTEERLPGLFRLKGKEHLPVTSAIPGQVVAAAKLTNTPAGSLLSPKGGAGKDLRAKALPVRQGVYAVSLEPVTQSDDDRLSAALSRLVAEDRTLTVDRVGDRTVLRGLGDTHLAVALERLARVFTVHVTTSAVPIGYKETIAKLASAEGKVKKQSGGHGQYAVVLMRVSPLPRGEGFKFVDSVVGGSIPRNYMSAVQKGITEAMSGGGVHGYEIVDIQVDVYDGKAHSVDSSDMAFRTAAALGVKEALAAGGSVVLEPVSKVLVTVPNSAQGDVMGDLSTRRGRINDTVSLDDGMVRIEASVPESELTRYILELRGLTGGRVALEIHPDRFEICPEHLVQSAE
ncbi:MAG: elongation factor G [Micrococcales bacterium]|nr:elongation factor G [Micrococcales bacterium]MCL2667740.1 elongation factor G [Micrococcales bacterium]